MTAEHIELSQSTLALVEQLRKSPDETREQIIVRALSLASQRPVSIAPGQGVDVHVGERPAIFFTHPGKEN